jgi:hypothetical protein
MGDSKPRERAPALSRVRLVMVVLVGWAALGGLLVHVARLPRVATPTESSHVLYGGLVAYSNDTAYLRTNGTSDLVAVSLPTFRRRAVLEMGATPTSLAWDGERVLLGLGAQKKGWALLRGDRWVVPPQWEDDVFTSCSVFRDVKSGSLVLAKLGPYRASEAGTYRSLSLATVGEDGRLGDPVQLRVSALIQDLICGSLEELYATSELPGNVCRIAAADAKGLHGCEPVPGERLQCSSVRSLGSPGELLGAERQQFARPPPAIVEGDMPNNYEFRLLPGGVIAPQAQWYSAKAGVVIAVPNGFVTIARDEETRENDRIGRNRPNHLELRLWGAQAETPRATAKVFGELFLPRVLVATDDEVIAYFDTSNSYARFQSSDLSRIDAKDTVRAVRERLKPWGGHSRVFEFLLSAALGMGPFVALALAFAREQARWQRRTAIGYAALVLVLLYWTAERIWWF